MKHAFKFEKEDLRHVAEEFVYRTGLRQTGKVVCTEDGGVAVPANQDHDGSARITALTFTIESLLSERPNKQRWVDFWAVAGCGVWNVGSLERFLLAHPDSFELKRRKTGAFDVRVRRHARKQK